MKTHTFLFQAGLFLFCTWGQSIHAQARLIVAPSDLVVSRNYNFSLSKIVHPDDSTFGRIQSDSNFRRRIITNDKVCEGFCLVNPHIDYPDSNGQFKPVTAAPAIACEYYKFKHDTSEPNKKYELDWGKDGYVENGTVNEVQISIQDFRLCGQGKLLRIFSIQNANNEILSDTQTIWFIDCDYIPSPALACHSELKVNLDEDCIITIDPALSLVGNKYCHAFYTTELRDWITNAIIDRDKNQPGSQLSYMDRGRTIKYIITDPISGENCTGRIIADDNTPTQLTCPKDITITCHENRNPLNTGIAEVIENCSKPLLNYDDFELHGGCEKDYEVIIHRTWTASDPDRNKSTCLQIIQVNNPLLDDVIFPSDYNGIDKPEILCHQIMDTTSDFLFGMIDNPRCVGFLILDSAYWLTHNTEPDVYPNRRIPKILGWNKISDPSHKSYGLPDPESYYYPVHPEWNFVDKYCWDANQHIMLEGTGLPSYSGCKAFDMSFRDSIVNKSNGLCQSPNPGCYEIYRFWTVIDWCKLGIRYHTQHIVVKDLQAPEILYPDTIDVIIPTPRCKGNWIVSSPWILESCSKEIHFVVESDQGSVTGNDSSGFSIDGLEPGLINARIIAWDCCGNTRTRQFVLHVIKTGPPVFNCQQNTTASITGNMAKIFAKVIEVDTANHCDPLFFKIIKLSELKGIGNGSYEDQVDDGSNCARMNGDDDSSRMGNQIYFDDFTSYCCAQVGLEIPTILRAFDADPGPGPIEPSRMIPGGDLFNRYSDCIVIVSIQDKTIPTLVAPPNMVVSCNVAIDLERLKNPNDSLFGRILNSLADRKKCYSSDIVCQKFCVRNDSIEYPGNDVPDPPPSNPPAPNRACDYYSSLYDSIHPDRIYQMAWGFDGYVLSACDNPINITIEDRRKCGQGKINRKIQVNGPTGVTVTATQTIWVVGCESYYPQIDIVAGNSKDPSNGEAEITLSADVSKNCQLPGSLQLTYEIDEFNDGSGKHHGFDYKVGPLSLFEYFAGMVPQTADNPRAFFQNHPGDASGRYPFGTHRIRWKAEDDCGRTSYADQLFTTSEIVSVDEERQSQRIQLYPNPANGNVMIQTTADIDQLKLVTSIGHLLKEIHLDKNRTILLNDLPAGAYMVQGFRDGEFVIAKTLVVLH